MGKSINLGERLVRLADRVLSQGSNESLGHSGGITSSTANDTSIPTTKAVKDYADSKAPYSHSSDTTEYGVASSTNYGHVRVINNLAGTGSTDALSAAQGKRLNEVKLETTTDVTLANDAWLQFDSPVLYSDSWVVYGQNQSELTITNTDVECNSEEIISISYQNNCQREIKIDYTLFDAKFGSSEQSYDIIAPGQHGALIHLDVDRRLTYTISGNYSKINAIANIIYPIGSVYINTINLNPTFIFGGRWEYIEDRLLLGNNDTYTNDPTSDETTHILTVDEIPPQYMWKRIA